MKFLIHINNMGLFSNIISSLGHSLITRSKLNGDYEYYKNTILVHKTGRIYEYTSIQSKHNRLI